MRGGETAVDGEVGGRDGKGTEPTEETKGEFTGGKRTSSKNHVGNKATSNPPVPLANPYIPHPSEPNQTCREWTIEEC